MTGANEGLIGPLLDRFPGPVQRRPSTRKWLGMLAVGIGFIALGAWFICQPLPTLSDTWPARALGALFMHLGLARDIPEAVAEFGWITLVFFAIGSVVSLVTVLPGAAGLTLTKDGFVVRSLFRGRAYRWSDVGEFAVTEVPYGTGSKKLVGFDDRLAVEGLTARANVKLSGRNSALPDTYGLSAEDLARLMSRWRQKAALPSN